MASGFPSCRLVLFLLPALLFTEATDGRKILQDVEEGVEDNTLRISSTHQGDPSVNIFFTVDNLRHGSKLPLYFHQRDESLLPPLLSRPEADSIPFSASNLSSLLAQFAIPKASLQARGMAYTLRECELRPFKEVKFCATSLESMLDSAVQTLGPSNIARTRVLATRFITRPSRAFQNYTVLEEPKEVPAQRMIGCHVMPYPYAVYYCHSQEGGNRVFEVSLGAEGGGGGETVRAVAVCHVDTSSWDPGHVAFKLLGTGPGRGPVCHVSPGEDLVWVNTS